jgi:uncharacterized membrane protein
MSKKNAMVPHTSAVVATQTTWSGPIPDPASLAAYQRLVPDAPERILSMAEEEARFRRELTQRDHDSANRTKESDVKLYHDGIKRGQIFAFIIIIACIVGTFACVMAEANSVAMILAGAGFASIAAQFISHKK